MPTVPVRAHETQVPVQAALQQTPWAQKLELHSAAIVQAAPLGSLPQLPLMQVFGAAQSALAVQVVRQAPAVLQAYGSHSVLVTVRQTPAPLQVRFGVRVDPLQPPVEQTVPSAQYRQAPIPLQDPSVPQVLAAVAGHWVAVTGGCPFAMLVQVPRLPATAHDRQVPVQASSQQRPCAQKFEAHSAAPVQTAPCGFLPQLPALHTFGATQSAAALHVVRQAPVALLQA